MVKFKYLTLKVVPIPESSWEFYTWSSVGGTLVRLPSRSGSTISFPRTVSVHRLIQSPGCSHLNLQCFSKLTTVWYPKGEYLLIARQRECPSPVQDPLFLTCEKRNRPTTESVILYSLRMVVRTGAFWLPLLLCGSYVCSVDISLSLKTCLV